ncbi:hypothetical protein KJ780_01105 [Candidatus Micrarchaeota archaeon]|nr:hypothetical protein [Candidatus Micrarchaeota archaeon]
MKVNVDKVASSTKNVQLSHIVDISHKIEAKEGSVIVGKALGENPVYGTIELVSGRMSKIIQGDIIAGVLGERRASRGFYGKVPKEIKPGDILHILNLGGVIGKAISANPEYGKPIEFEVLGQAIVYPHFEDRIGKAANITDSPVKWKDKLDKSVPLIAVSASNMDAGKTTAACEIIKGLNAKGFRVGAAKVTGVSLMRDTLNMEDYGAVKALSFNDAGVVSTTTMKHVAEVAKGLITELNKCDLDCIVFELGDGIMGGYGVEYILKDKEIMGFTKAHVVCAPDPVAVWGIREIFKKYGLSIDIVSGKVTDNSVGSEFVEKELGLPAANAIKDKEKLVTLIKKKVFK